MQQKYEQENDTTRYIPVADIPVIAEPHIEDYLDHVCAPLIGILSYEDRQRFRETKREELESTIWAHIELGSTREEAIAATLLARAVPVQTAVKPVLELSTQHTENVTVNKTAWRQTQRTAFKLAMGNALMGIPAFEAISQFYPSYAPLGLQLASTAILPTIAGCIMGYLSPYKAGKAWVRASLLAAPLVPLCYLAFRGFSWHSSFREAIAYAGSLCTLHTVVSVLFGSIGIWAGSAFRKRQRTRRSEIKLKNPPSH